MERQILVCLDGSDLAEQVLPLAAAFGRATQSGLILFQVVPSSLMMEAMIWPTATFSTSLDPDVLTRQAYEYLEPLATRWQAPDLPIRCAVMAGDPAQTIVQYTADHPAITLVAVASHGRGGLGRWLFGSVAAKLLQIAVTPLLLVHAALTPASLAPEGPRSILVPLDGSRYAAQALPEAEVLARAFGAALLLVRVVPSVTEIARAGLASVELLEQYEQQVARAADDLRDQAQAVREQGTPAHTQILRGAPADEILAVAEQAGVDLIVMSTHGRGEWEHFWLGSVAWRVLQHARQPVVLIRAYVADTRRPARPVANMAVPELAGTR